MKKVSLVVLDRYKETALKKLRSLGLVHIEQMQGDSEKLSIAKSEYGRLELASILLSDIKVDKKNSIASVSLTTEEALLKAEEVINLFESKKNFTEELSNALKEKERLIGWGGVRPEDFEYLSQKGLYLSMFEIPSESYTKIPESVKTIYVSRTKSLTRFLTLNDTKDKPEFLPPEAFSVPMPDISTELIEENIASYKNVLADISSDIISATGYISSIKKALYSYEKDIEFENIFSGMDIDASETSHAITWLTGFIPAQDTPNLTELAKKEHWALLLSDPSDDDEVPTKLKNNKLVSLIYPVTDFLGTVPGYREYDISGWFLLFFSIFFGMIFGDAGYGTLLLILGLVPVLASLFKGKKPSEMFVLLCLLGLSTLLWGVVTCTWFGIDPAMLPRFFTDISFMPLSNANPDKTILTQNIKVFCFTLALLQMSIAHIKGIISNRKTVKCLGELGSLLMLWGIFYIVLYIVVDKIRFPMDLLIFGIPSAYLVLPAIGGGFLLNFVFINYDGSIIKSILASVSNIISVFLGVVNIFSDIVSYIRLWAVALAGGAISQTINTMAGPMLGGAIIFLGILLLVFGHGLNMVLNVLSVLVHGVRLNTLEFSGHLGMTWSGFSYKPFKNGEI